MADSDEQTRLFRVWKTVHSMLQDRGYLVEQQFLDMTIETFKDRFSTGSLREQLTILNSKRDDQQDRIFVFFVDEPKITIPVLNKYAQRM
jgi:DNA-directed RNA polymerase I, II, and III subunit RPABC1